MANQGSLFDAYKVEFNITVGTQIKVTHENFIQQFNVFKSTFIGATRGIGGQVDNVELQLMGMNSYLRQGNAYVAYVLGACSGETADPMSRTTTNQEQNAAGVSNLAAKVIKEIKGQMIAMENKLSGLLAKGDESAIKFAGLGFQSISHSNAWLEANLRKHPSGLIVDIHMVLEHIHYALEGIDTMAMMEKLYKIKVTCIADSIAMTSFDTKTPKFFCKVQGHCVLNGDASYLDTIATQNDWSDVGMGFKMQLQEAVAEFQELHGTFIDQAVEIGSRPHTLAHAALIKLVAWLIGFIQFMDEYYHELSKASLDWAKHGM
jgi:hypothetical protein